jgi:LytS/YehU family sensor histidine kinase
MPVTIDVNSQDSSLEIKVKNRISNQPSLIPSTNIGIDNLKTRFQLHLQNKHRFEIRNENGWYEVVVLVGENVKST